MKNPTRCHWPFTGPVLAILAGLAPWALEDGKAQLLDTLRVRDELLARGFTIDTEVRIPAVPFDPSQGEEIRATHVTSDGTDLAAEAVVGYSQTHVYKEVGTLDYQSFDYDKQDRLVLWRTLSSQSLVGPDRAVNLVRLQSHHVAPDGAVTKDEEHVQLQQFAPGSDAAIPEIVHTIMAFGRGFSRYLDTIEDVAEVGDGTTKIIAKGKYGAALSGTWELVLEPAAEYLVRSATFTSETSGVVQVRVTTSGENKGGRVPLATSGTLTHALGSSGHTLKASLSEYGSGPDAEFLVKIRRSVAAELSPGAEIIDYTSSPPVRSFVGE